MNDEVKGFSSEDHDRASTVQDVPLLNGLMTQEGGGGSRWMGCAEDGWGRATSSSGLRQDDSLNVNSKINGNICSRAVEVGVGTIPEYFNKINVSSKD